MLKQYEYDHDMIQEMVLTMENDEVFQDCVNVVLEIYGVNDIACYSVPMMMHIASYARNAFDYVWCENESHYYLQPEYFQAVYIFLQDYIEQYINDRYPSF